jgi:UDP-N-acetylmuramoyl-tripeptide--D-alanyl-D-alanine ligase
MRRFISRFSREYDRSLLYMLQASEYDLQDYFAWYRRVKDFRTVQKRKRLAWTLKVKALYAAEWVLTISVIFIGIRLIDSLDFATWLVVILLLALLDRLIVPLWFALVVLVARFIQEPVEQWIIARAKAKLSKHKAFKIAIAGSYGKTSMREILRTVLSEGKRVAAPGGSENTPIGIARFVDRLKGDEEVLIFELGEYYPGDVRQLAELVQPDLGIITGVNEAHLSKMKTLETVSDTIFELADSLHNKPLYINAESDHLKVVEKAITFTRSGVGEWKVVAPETSLDGTSFSLEHNGIRINAQSKLLGLHQVGPLAAAAHIALSLGLSVRQIEEGIAKTKAFAHRLAPREDGGVITLDDSYNGNPNGVKAVLEFLASLEGHRRWYVTPGLVEMGNRSEEIHRDIGKQLAEANIEKVVLIKNSVTPWIEEGLKENSYGGDIMWFDDALKCYEQLPYMTVSGDVVVLQNDWPDQYA